MKLAFQHSCAYLGKQFRLRYRPIQNVDLRGKYGTHYAAYSVGCVWVQLRHPLPSSNAVFRRRSIKDFPHVCLYREGQARRRYGPNTRYPITEVLRTEIMIRVTACPSYID